MIRIGIKKLEVVTYHYQYELTTNDKVVHLHLKCRPWWMKSEGLCVIEANYFPPPILYYKYSILYPSQKNTTQQNKTKSKTLMTMSHEKSPISYLADLNSLFLKSSISSNSIQRIFTMGIPI